MIIDTDGLSARIRSRVDQRVEEIRSSDLRLQLQNDLVQQNVATEKDYLNRVKQIEKLVAEINAKFPES